MSYTFTSHREIQAMNDLDDAVALHSQLITYRSARAVEGDMGPAERSVVTAQIVDTQRRVRRAIAIIRHERWINTD